MKNWRKTINEIGKHLIIESVEQKNQLELMLSSIGHKVEETDTDYLLIDNFSKIFLRKASSDLKVFEQININMEYEIVYSILQLNNAFPKFIIDCGANIGLTSIQMAKLFPNAAIISVEPDLANYGQLLKNIKNYKNIKPLQRAIWNKKTQLITDRNFRDGQDWAVRTIEINSQESSNTTKVESVTINEILNQFRYNTIDLLKIDIEGAEQYLFNNESDLSFLDKTTVIAIEIHDEYKIRDMIYRKLKEYSYILMKTGELTVAVKNI